jgi:hypothetical protein
MSSCEPESYDFTLFDKPLSNPNYSPVYIKVNYLFNLCLFKVSQLFCKHAIPKICVSSLFSPVKKRNMLCSGETFEIERKLYHPSLLLIWVPVYDSSHQVHTCVSNVKFVLCGGWGGQGLQKYILYAQMSIHCIEYAFTVR